MTNVCEAPVEAIEALKEVTYRPEMKLAALHLCGSERRSECARLFAFASAEERAKKIGSDAERRRSINLCGVLAFIADVEKHPTKPCFRFVRSVAVAHCLWQFIQHAIDVTTHNILSHSP